MPASMRQIGRITLDIAPLALLRKVAHVENLDVADVVVITTTQPPPAQPAESRPFPQQLPVDIVLDRLIVSNIRVNHDGADVFNAQSFATARPLGNYEIAIEELALRAKQGEVDLDAQASTAGDNRGKAKGRFRWNVDGTDYAGTLDATSDGNLPTATLHLEQPVVLDATVSAEASNWPLAQRNWLFRLQANRFDAKKLLKDTTLQTLGFDVSGKRRHVKGGEFAGTIDVDDYRVLVNPARFALAEKTLQIETLAVTSPNVPGSVETQGQRAALPMTHRRSSTSSGRTCCCRPHWPASRNSRAAAASP